MTPDRTVAFAKGGESQVNALFCWDLPGRQSVGATSAKRRTLARRFARLSQRAAKQGIVQTYHPSYHLPLAPPPLDRPPPRDRERDEDEDRDELLDEDEDRARVTGMTRCSTFTSLQL